MFTKRKMCEINTIIYKSSANFEDQCDWSIYEKICTYLSDTDTKSDNCETLPRWLNLKD